MSEDRPLHVRVAEALGWTDVSFMGKTWWGYGPLRHRELGVYLGKGAIPRYDTDWSATGPLIEKYDIGLTPSVEGAIPRYDTDWSATGPLIEKYRIELTPPGAPEGESDWGATTWDPPANARGGEALVAICHLLLALHEAGKLKP